MLSSNKIKPRIRDHVRGFFLANPFLTPTSQSESPAEKRKNQRGANPFLNGAPVKLRIEVACLLHDFESKILHVFVPVGLPFNAFDDPIDALG